MHCLVTFCMEGNLFSNQWLYILVLMIAINQEWLIHFAKQKMPSIKTSRSGHITPTVTVSHLVLFRTPLLQAWTCQLKLDSHLTSDGISNF